MFSLVIPLFIFFLGVCVGSFVNVITLRFGFSETSRRRSYCMACNHLISWYDLVPVLSYLVLRGRCRTCGSALTLQYPAVELTVGVLYLLAWLVIPPFLTVWSLASFSALLVFLAALVALVVYDLRHTLVPLSFAFTLAFSALASSLVNAITLQSFVPLVDSALGGVVLFGFFALTVLITKGRGMGMGDAYIAAATGLLFGVWRGIEAVMIGVWSATAVYLLVLLLSSLFKKSRLLPRAFRVTMRTELPFVPFLALGIVIALFTNISPLALGNWLTALLW